MLNLENFLVQSLGQKKIFSKNLKIALPQISNEEIKNISKNMWKNYGRILAEYMYIKDFGILNLKNSLKIENSNILEDINKKINQLFLFLVISTTLNFWRW